MSNRCKALEGKIAVITGAAQGLGEALAHRLDKEGCKVVVADINIEKARMVANSLTDAVAFGVDVTKEEQVNALMKLAMDTYGTIDILVSNAAILISKATTDFPLDEWKKMMDVNINGYFLCARAAARIMAEKGKGSIIQINSKSGKKGSYKNAAYATSKFAGIGLTQSLALEMAECGVRVNAICPGNLLDSPLWVNSLYKQYAANQGITEEEVRQKYLDQVPMKRGCTYDDVANLMVFLASDQSSYMTGQAINVTGGQEMR
ncbi:MAG: sorbitol-6-phosphate dehydrogenase [Clostridiaceae bacterium]|jgi:sorbitol-6-phosphate 2-dehydrogenase|nr:sorbitol-6-phosphate dehydrogenase [Clostridiaceae bacterium]